MLVEDEDAHREHVHLARGLKPVGEMLFIIRGRLESVTTDGGRNGFFNSVSSCTFIADRFSTPSVSSQQWRTWAACFIQAACHHYRRKFAEKQCKEEEEGFDYSEGDDDDDCRGDSITSKLRATFFVFRFAAKVLQGHRHHSAGSTGSMGSTELMKLQKPPEPDFSAYDDKN
ncbi:putative cyclic nucleotide-gated ion channel 8 [Prunus yedoensis var. nudiflora]|uniref:Putative cyclic nucleotide-gated ion channel 8 n=1 Tax=Prunus yedoensis var. nudiflora TaxID=2094558 RepID=A0A314Z276_PRUYE|nr:putative cyclic nucleotide-gated ion channel 8 [Prunus yedoensis var. nudiflora]